MKLIVKNRSFFGITKFFYDALYVNDPNYEGYNIASASVHTQPTKIQTSAYTPV